MVNKEKLTQLLDNLNLNKDKSFNNITKVQGEFLSTLVEIKKPKNILELGTSNGYSTTYLLKNIEEEGLITTIDIDEERTNLAKENFLKIDATKNVNQKLVEGMEFLENCENKFDLIFVDFLQSKYLDILKLIDNKKLISEKGIVIFDNFVSHRALELKSYCEKENLTYSIVKMGKGFIIINF